MSKRLELDPGERSHLVEMRALTSDQKGVEILVGLTREETDFYLAHAKTRSTRARSEEATARYLDLHEKHERARLSVLSAEIELREDEPRKH